MPSLTPVRPAIARDLPEAAAVLAEAFAEDPPMRFLLGEHRRVARLRRYFTTVLPVYERLGEVWVSEEPFGAAAWLAPGRSLPLSLEARVAPVFVQHPVRALAGLARVTAGIPREPHWFLDYIAVSASARSRGVGSALLRAVLERCDAAEVPAYLHAGSERSRDLYARHGFEVTEVFALPFGGPELWRMWRAPANGGLNPAGIRGRGG